MRLKKRTSTKKHCALGFLKVSFHFFHSQVFQILLFFEELLFLLFTSSLLTSYVNLVLCFYLVLASCVPSSIMCVYVYVFMCFTRFFSLICSLFSFFNFVCVACFFFLFRSLFYFFNFVCVSMCEYVCLYVQIDGTCNEGCVEKLAPQGLQTNIHMKSTSKSYTFTIPYFFPLIFHSQCKYFVFLFLFCYIHVQFCFQVVVQSQVCFLTTLSLGKGYFLNPSKI